MCLGEKLRCARLEAGMTQRQLCGEMITRNMLSQIENGKATPSTKTLRYLAQMLGKPVSYFLEEGGELENQDCMSRARAAYSDGKFASVCEILTQYRGPDVCFDWEMGLLRYLSFTAMAEEAAAEGRQIIARKFLKQAMSQTSPYITAELRQRCRRLSTEGQEPTEEPEEVPPLYGELFYRSRLALAAGDGARAGALLDAMEDKEQAQWSLCRGEAYLYEKNYPRACEALRRAQPAMAEKALPLLERCYREQGDFENAYLCACTLRNKTAGG